MDKDLKISMCAVKKIKKLIKKIPGVKPLLRYERPGFGTVYMLHRVCPHNPQALYPNENLKASPEFLEKFILKKQKKYDFISLDSLADMLTSETERTNEQTNKRTKPFICFTLDDGYKDNFEYAVPIFEKYKVPYAVYVTTCFPDKTAFLWWFILDTIIQKNACIELSNGKRFPAKNKDEKEKAFLDIRVLLLSNSQKEFEKKFYSLLSNYTADIRIDLDEYVLSWNDIRTMSNSPLCTIAAHTKNHSALSQLDESAALYEIIQGKTELENKIGKPVLHLAYPYGSAAEVSEREYALAKKCGFKTAVLSYGGNFKRLDGCNLFALPRKLLSDL